MKNINWTDLAFVIFFMGGLAVLIVVAICAYQDTQSRIKWREYRSLETLEMVKREAVNEYISKQ